MTTLARTEMAWWAGLILLGLRGVLLWIIVPLAFLLWLISWPFLHRRHLTLGAVIGWADLNLICAMQRSLLRIGTQNPVAWTPWREAGSVTHRVTRFDPA